MHKKEIIIHAAVKVFGRTGLERGKIADVAKEAGIGKGTVYEYFRSKEEIFRAIEKYYIDSMIEPLRVLVESEVSPGEKIMELMGQSIDMILHMGDALLMITEIMSRAARGTWQDADETPIADMYAEYRDIIIEILKDGVTRGEFREMNFIGIATLLMGFIDGLVWQYLIIGKGMEFEKVKDEAIHSFMKGIEK